MTVPTIVTVLRSGGDFGPEHVHALRVGIAAHLPTPHRVVCLTDMELDVPGVEAVPLLHGWPGWWSLVEWYRPGIAEGRVLAMGLDTLIVGSLSGLAAYSGPLAGINDLYRPRVLASGVMAWEGDEAAPLYEAFLAAGPEDVMRRFPRHDPWLRTVAPDAERLQEHVRGIYSYKAHCRSGPPDDAVVVCLHGKPRIQDPDAGWAHELWRENAGAVGAAA